MTREKKKRFKIMINKLVGKIFFNNTLCLSSIISVSFRTYFLTSKKVSFVVFFVTFAAKKCLFSCIKQPITGEAVQDQTVIKNSLAVTHTKVSSLCLMTYFSWMSYEVMPIIAKENLYF